MDPDPLREGGDFREGGACNRLTSERERPHGDAKPADTLDSSHYFHVQPHTSKPMIDLTEDTDDNHRKHSQPQQPPSDHPNKRTKLSHQGDISEAATGKNIQNAKLIVLHQHSQVQKELEATKPAFIAAEEELDRRGQSMAATRNVLEVSSENRTLTEKLQESQTQNERLHAQLAQKDEELRSMVEQLEAGAQERESIRKQEISIRAKLDDANQHVKSLEKDLERLQSKAEKAETKAKALQESLQAAKKLQSAFELTNEHLGVKSKDFKDTKKKFTKDLNEAKKELTSSKAEHEAEKSKLTTKNEELQAEYELYQQETNEGKIELLQQIRDLQGLSQRHIFKISDEELIEQWGSLKHKISQMVDKYARPVWVLNEQDLGPGWTVLSSKIAFLLGSPLLHTFAFEAYLWAWLSAVVFRFDSNTWAGNLGQSLSHLSENVSRLLRGPEDELMPEYHRWRSTSNNLFSRLNQRTYNHESYQTDVHCLISDLGRVLRFDQVSWEGAFADAVSIFHDARSFDIVRRKLKAEIRLISHSPGAEEELVTHSGCFFSSYMRDRSPGASAEAPRQGSIFDLIISPAIIRTGNSDGVDYSREICLVKMDVLCDVSTLSASQEQSMQMMLTGLSAHPHSMARENSATLPNREEHGEGKISTIEGDAKIEAIAQLSNHNIPALPVLPSLRAASPVSAGGCLHDDSAKNNTGRPTRACAVATRAAMAQAIEEPDELAGFPNSDADKASESKPSSSRKSRTRQCDDEAYVEDENGDA